MAASAAARTRAALFEAAAAAHYGHGWADPEALRMRIPWAALALAPLFMQVVPAAAQGQEVDLELVLAVDVSRSMDSGEQRIQREGYISAIKHPEVIAAIKSGLIGRIAVTYVEWAGPGSQQVIVPWTAIDGLDSAEAFSRRIEPGLVLGRFGTSISSSLSFSAALFEDNGFSGMRRVIDVSGDGPNNIGPPVLPAREAVLAQGITINGLPIVLERNGRDPFGVPDLNAYYRDCVVGGPGAFTLAVTAMDQFETAVRRKLIQEIAAAEPRAQLAAEEEADSVSDCLIGEKLRGRRGWGAPSNR
jgi:hypothetical protein